MRNKKPRSDLSEHIVVLILLVVLQTLTLIIAIGAVPILSQLDQFLGQFTEQPLPANLIWLQGSYWIISAVLGSITAVLAIVAIIIGIIYRLRMEQVREVAAAINPSPFIGPQIENVETQARRNLPRLLLVESIGVGIFTLIAAFITLFAINRELDAPTQIGLYFGAAALIIWVSMEALQLYYLLPQRPRKGAVTWGTASAVIRILGALVIWTYLGLSRSMKNMELLLTVGAILLLLGMVGQIVYLFLDKRQAEKEEDHLLWDKLTRVTGITQEIQTALAQKNVRTFEALTRQTSTDLDKILADAAGVYTAVSTTWPYQADLIRQGDQNLAPLQENVSNWSGAINNLQKLEGVNKTIEQQLWLAGIFSYRQLYEMHIDDLQELNPPLLGINNQRVYQQNEPIYQWPPQLVKLWPRQAQLLNFEQDLIALSGLLTARANGDDGMYPVWWVNQLLEKVDARKTFVRAGIDTIATRHMIDSFQLLTPTITHRIEEILHANGLVSYQQLVDISPSALQELLGEAGCPLHVNELAIWQSRAQLVIDEGFDGLANAPTRITSDPFEQIEGINADIMAFLNESGYYTFDELAELNGRSLQSLHTQLTKLSAQNKTDTRLSKHKLATWPYQAELARQENVSALTQFKAELKEAEAQRAIYKAGMLALSRLAECENAQLEEIVNELIMVGGGPAEKKKAMKQLQEMTTELQTIMEELSDVADKDDTASQQRLQRLQQIITQYLVKCYQQIIAQPSEPAAPNDPQEKTETPATLTEQPGKSEESDKEAEKETAVQDDEETKKPATADKSDEETAVEAPVVLPARHPDDFTVIEGITGEIEQILQQANILTYRELAESDLHELQAVLQAGGKPYQLHELLPWLPLAELAADGKLDTVTQIQAELRANLTADDLTKIEIITAEIQEILQSHHILTYRQLANSTDPALRIYLDNQNVDYHLANLLTWRYQAQLAAAGDWETLEKDQQLMRESSYQQPSKAAFTQIIGLNITIENLLRHAGIRTIADLAACQTDKLLEILIASEEPAPYRMLDLLTWPQQARLIAEDKLDELEQFQAELLIGYQADDLTRIEGIGPAIRAILYRNKLLSFADLAAADVETLRLLLENEGEDFRLANYPETWPEQAALARDGKWDELNRLQAALKAGRREEDETPDALTSIEGIGPKIQALLYSANIFTFRQLATTSASRLRQILDEAGKNFRVANTPEMWPVQAALARDSKWEELQILQQELKGGRKGN